MELVPNTMEEVLDIIGDYGIYPWLKQIQDGTNVHSSLTSEQAMLLSKLIELSEEAVK